MSMLDVGEVRGIATAVRGMPIRPARASISRTLALGHTDTLHIKIRHVLGHAFRLVGGHGDSTEREQTHKGPYDS
jgi:hypothetical protein